MSFKKKFEKRIDSYTGNQVREQLRNAYKCGYLDLYESLKQKLMDEKQYEAIAILKDFDVDGE
jgi:hypothetical protein